MELSLRLQAVCNLVTIGNRVADVGCDHGYVSIYLVENKISPKVIAMDVNRGPLLRAEEHIQESGLSYLIETRLSDGFSSLHENEADTVICAGMGGRLIIKIMKSGKKIVAGVGEFILQPQSEICQVRQFIRENGFIITDEDMIFEDGKYYPMMRVVPKKSSENPDEISENRYFDKFGPVLLQKKNPVLYQFLTWEREKYTAIYQALTSVSLPTAKQSVRITEVKQELYDIDEAINRHFL